METLKDEFFQDLEQTHSKDNDVDIKGETLMMAKFIMVAKDPFTGRAVQVNPLKLENDHQMKLFQIAESMKKCKLEKNFFIIKKAN